MRHGKTINQLGRTTSHRKAMLSNLASSLILHKRISTTVAKAKALRKYVEPLITKSKEDTTHSRRTVFSHLQNKDSVKSLFSEVSEKVASRPGGYTRIIKTGSRLGDNAEMCIIELVDFNTIYGNEEVAQLAKKTRRGKKVSSPSDLLAPATDSAVPPLAAVSKVEAVSENPSEEVSGSSEEPKSDPNSATSEPKAE